MHNTFTAVWNSIDKIWRRLQLTILIGKINLVDDTTLIQLVQARLSANETKDTIPRIQHYGFASNPTPGSDFVGVAISGDRNNIIIIGENNVDERFKNLASGEAAIYNKTGQYVYLTVNEGIVIEANGANVTINNAAEVTVNASTKVRLVTPRLEVTGDIIDNCDIQTDTMHGMRTAYNTHTHNGVQTGAGNTGGPNNPM